MAEPAPQLVSALRAALDEIAARRAAEAAERAQRRAKMRLMDGGRKAA